MPKRPKAEDEKMIAISFRLPPNILDELRDKAGSVPVSVIVRILVEKWLKGEIRIDFN